MKTNLMLVSFAFASVLGSHWVYADEKSDKVNDLIHEMYWNGACEKEQAALDKMLPTVAPKDVNCPPHESAQSGQLAATNCLQATRAILEHRRNCAERLVGTLKGQTDKYANDDLSLGSHYWGDREYQSSLSELGDTLYRVSEKACTSGEIESCKDWQAVTAVIATRKAKLKELADVNKKMKKVNENQLQRARKTRRSSKMAATL